MIPSTRWTLLVPMPMTQRERPLRPAHRLAGPAHRFGAWTRPALRFAGQARPALRFAARTRRARRFGMRTHPPGRGFRWP